MRSWLTVLLKHNIMPKVKAALFLHDMKSTDAVVDKLRSQFPSLDAVKIAAEVTVAELLSLSAPTIPVQNAVLGHIGYRNLQVVGHGGYGQVFRGEDTSGQFIFAIKRSLPKVMARTHIDTWINAQLRIALSLIHI